MGSRYGSLKQMDGVGPNGEAIIDYSIYDAIPGRVRPRGIRDQTSVRERIPRNFHARALRRENSRRFRFSGTGQAARGVRGSGRPDETLGNEPCRNDGFRHDPRGAVRSHQCRRLLRRGRLPDDRRLSAQRGRPEKPLLHGRLRDTQYAVGFRRRFAGRVRRGPQRQPDFDGRAYAHRATYGPHRL